MSGLVFEALLPDFTVADRTPRPQPSADFVPLFDGGPEGRSAFETLAPGTSRPEAASREAARNASAQNDKPDSDGGIAEAVESELDRRWEEMDRPDGDDTADESPAAVREQYEAEIASLKAVHAAEIASLTVHAVEEMETRIARALEEHLVSILGAVMSEQHQQKSVRAFAQKVGAMASDGAAVRLRVSGPQRLVDAFRAEAGDNAARYDFEVSDTPELQVAIDQSILSTRFGDWHAALEQVMA